MLFSLSVYPYLRLDLGLCLSVSLSLSLHLSLPPSLPSYDICGSTHPSARSHTDRYLPAHLSWPVLTAHSNFPAVEGATPAAGSGVGLSGGPELGLACELALAEMRMDKALSLIQQQHTTRRGVNPTATSTSGPSVPGAAPAAATASAAAGASAAAVAGVAVPGPAATVSSDGGKATELPPGGSSAGVPERVEACSRLSLDRRRVEAMSHLAVADGAMLELEPWCLSIGDGGYGGGGVPDGK